VLWEEQVSMRKTRQVSFALALVLAGAGLVAGCDQNSADADAGKDKLAGAFDGELKDCAAAAHALSVWNGKPYAEATSVLQPQGPVTSIRVIRPGTMVTKDYRIDRLNVDLDDKDVVTKIYCG
jgi:uncharacterized membrane protein